MVDQHSTCNLPLGKPTARLLQEADIIIWDEAPIMVSHKHLFEATDRSLRDIMKEVSPELGSLPFGGKVAVMGGDFRSSSAQCRLHGRAVGGAIPVEYSNTLLPSGLPPHRLTLKIGAPIMLLMNIRNKRALHTAPG